MDYRLSEEYGQAVAQQLRAEIAAAGVSVVDVSRAVDIPRVSLDRYLKGARTLTVPTLYRICAGIPIDPRTLIERATLRFHEDTAVAPSSSSSIRPIRSIADYRKEPRPDVDDLAAGDVEDDDD